MLKSGTTSFIKIIPECFQWSWEELQEGSSQWLHAAGPMHILKNFCLIPKRGTHNSPSPTPGHPVTGTTRGWGSRDWTAGSKGSTAAKQQLSPAPPPGNFPGLGN